MALIKTEFIKLKKTDLMKNRLLIAIDSGSTLTKVLFLNKNKKDEFFDKNTNTLTLEFNLFHNDNFDDALEFVKLNAFQVEYNHYNVHITGVFALKHQDKVKSILNHDVVFIDEFTTVSTGIKFALEHIGIDNLILETAGEDSYGKIESDIWTKFDESIINEIKENELRMKSLSLYPHLFHVHGSGAGCFYFDENGNNEYCGLVHTGGKTFLGLAKCLLDTNDYNEVVDLACRGDKTNTDTMVRERFEENPNLPYGKLLHDLHMLLFGQYDDNNKSLDEFRKEDIAKSLLSLHSHSIINICNIICITKRISKVYVIGNIFGSELFRKEFQKITSSIHLGIEYVFLNFGFFGVLGAMISNEGDESIFR